MGNIFRNLFSRVEFRKTKIKTLVFYFPWIVIISLLSLKIGWGNGYGFLCGEDSIIEYCQFVVYSLASAVSFLACVFCLKKGFMLNGSILLLFTILLITVSMEEISWGQRIFDISTPSWFIDHNKQEEISLHNLYPVQNHLHQAYAFIGFILTFGWIPVRILFKMQNINNNLKKMILLFSPKWYLMFYFMPTFIIYSYFLLDFNENYVKGNGFVRWYDQEPAELLLAVGALFFLLDIALKLKVSSLNVAMQHKGSRI